MLLTMMMLTVDSFGDLLPMMSPIEPRSELYFVFSILYPIGLAQWELWLEFPSWFCFLTMLEELDF